MKLNYAIIVGILHLLPAWVKGQKAPPQYLPSQTYQISRDLDFVVKYESNSIVRDNDYFINHFGTAAEVKLSKEVTLNTTFRALRQSTLLFQNGFVDKASAVWQGQIGIEPRWHWSGISEITEDAHAKNPFLGNYMGIKLQAESGFRANPMIVKTLLTFGTQRFFYTSPMNNLDNALDINMGIGLAFQKNNTASPAFQVTVTQGLILNNFLPKYRKNNQPPSRLTENLVLTDKKSLFKIDLFNLIGRADDANLVEEINLAYERKLGKSPFSISVSSTVSPYFLTTNAPSVNNRQTTGIRWATSIEPRWYYDLRKRILSGQSGNNLSGAFLSTEFLYQWQRIERVAIDGKTSKVPLKNLTFTPIWGTQQRLSSLIFYEFRMGVGVRTTQDLQRHFFDNSESVIFADVLLGLAF